VNDDAQRIKDAIDPISYIQLYVPSLKKKGRLHEGLCPFHQEKSPSFIVYPDGGYKCYGTCGEHGDIIDFTMKIHHCDFGDALEELARHAHITLTPLTPAAKEKQDKTARLYTLMEDAAGLLHHHLLSSGGKSAMRYLMETRKLSEETIMASRLGYAPDSWQWLYEHFKKHGYTDKELLAAGLIKEGNRGPYDTFRNRVVTPIRDMRGRIVAFSGRAMGKDETPKYLHNATTDIFQKSSLIHRMPEFDAKRRAGAFKTVVVVEGSLDPISAAQNGIFNIASLLGKEVTDTQMGLLCNSGAERLVFCLDKDEAGRNALRILVEKYAATAAQKGVSLYAMAAPHGKDPDDTFREMPHLWQPVVDAARPVVDVLLEMELASLPADASAVLKTKAALSLMPILRSENPMIEQENLRKLATYLAVTVDEMERWAKPQMELLPKAAPASLPTKTAAPSVPTLEEWVVHGLLVNEDEDWLTRANTRLLIASVDNLPYALAPLSIQDFTEAPTRRLMDLILKGESPADLYVEGKLELALRKPYERIATLDSIGKDYNLSFDFNVFVDAVYELIADKDPSKSRECARAIACLRLAQEDLIEA
jgi:DNA primase